MQLELQNKPQRYINEPFVYLETADHHIFVEPYGPHHAKAVGKVFCLELIQGGEYTAVNVSYVEQIEPWLFDPRIEDEMQILVEQEEVIEGKRHLHARIVSTRDGSGRRDTGTKLHIVLFKR